jgi:hypothetical protein
VLVKETPRAKVMTSPEKSGLLMRAMIVFPVGVRI